MLAFVRGSGRFNVSDQETPQELGPGVYRIDLRKLVVSLFRVLKSGVLLFRIEKK